jgi:hypothetical protein
MRSNSFDILGISTGLFVALGALQGQQCTNYPAEGSAAVNLTVTFQGDPVCHFGAVSNSLAWHAKALGTKACPTQFQLWDPTMGVFPGLRYRIRWLSDWRWMLERCWSRRIQLSNHE